MFKTILTTVLIAATFCFHPHIASAQHTKQFNNMAGEILHYVNEYREHRGLCDLAMADVICKEAETHSCNMACDKVPFSHDGFDERADRIRRQIKPVNAWAENVAYGAESAKEVVEMWLHSPGHRKNIEGKYNMTGIGIAKSRGGSLYFTQIFVNKRS
jgi:uncharacterized protein YkwD